jgi:hypothetical protein
MLNILLDKRIIGALPRIPLDDVFVRTCSEDILVTRVDFGLARDALGN